MDELPAHIEQHVMHLSELGNQAVDRLEHDAAISYWKEALKLLPSPKSQWDAAMWLYASIGDMYRRTDRMPEALSYFQSADVAGDGHANPFVQFSLGATLYDLERYDEATAPLLRAYMLEGRPIFEGEFTDYIEHLERQNLVVD